MVDKSDPVQWRPGGEASEGDSIAGQLASRIEKVPPSPGDAMDWAAIAARYEREAVALGDRPGAAELLFEAGRVFEERMGDAPAALEFYRRAFTAGRHFLPNLRALRRMAQERGDASLAADTLTAEAELVEDPATRAGLLEERAALVGPAAEPTAPGPAAPTPAPPPAPLPAAQAEAEAAAAASDESGLLAAYERCAGTAGDPRLSAHYLLAASEVAGEGLGDAQRAGTLALAAFARYPGDPLVRSAARLHAARTGDLLSLAEVLRADAAGADGLAAAGALTELARVEERLGHGDQAAASLEQAWTLAPDDPRVLSELARLREARREWPAAADALEALAAAHMARGGPGHRLEAVAAKLRRLEIEEAQLRRSDEAMRCCRDVLELEPGQRTALTSLGRLCAGAGDWEGVLAAFRAEAEAARDPRERAQRTFKAAQILEERLGKASDAVLAYRAALAQDPDLLAARSALERLLEREGRWEELCHLVEAEIAAGSTPAEEVEMLFRLARLEEERRRDPTAAARRYRRILEVEPGNPAALRALRLILERAGAGPELAEALAEEARRADPRRRLALLQRRAEVLEELAGEPDRALEAWDEIRTLRPDHLPALRALGRLHAAAGRWDAVAAQFRAQRVATHDPVRAAELLLRAAEIEERRLFRPDAAIALYREVLTLQPAHLLALQCLSRLYRSRDDHEALAEVLLALASSREAPAERAAVLAELGEILRGAAPRQGSGHRGAPGGAPGRPRLRARAARRGAALPGAGPDGRAVGAATGGARRDADRRPPRAAAPPRLAGGRPGSRWRGGTGRGKRAGPGAARHPGGRHPRASPRRSGAQGARPGSPPRGSRPAARTRADHGGGRDRLPRAATRGHRPGSALGRRRSRPGPAARRRDRRSGGAGPHQRGPPPDGDRSRFPRRLGRAGR